MKVFVSWSGSYAREVAVIIKELLPRIVGSIEFFVSGVDIESGSVWSERLRQELAQSSFGICCLCAENRASHWMIFEAGVLERQTRGRVCGLLLGGLKPAEVDGPFAQFQHRSFTRDDVWLLVSDLNVLNGNTVSSEALRTSFDIWWPTLNQRYESVVLTRAPGLKQIRSQNDLLEEVLGRVHAAGKIPPKPEPFIIAAELKGLRKTAVHA